MLDTITQQKEKVIIRGFIPEPLDFANEIKHDVRLKSKHTKRGYLNDLTAFESWRNGQTMTRSLVEAYADDLMGKGKSAVTINRSLAAIRWWARKNSDYLQELNIDPTDIAAKQYQADWITKAERVAHVKNIDTDGHISGRNIDQGELNALIFTCANDPTPCGTRDAALIAIAWVTGLRRSEIKNIRLSDIHDTGDIIEIKVKGKREKQNTVYLDDGSADAVRDWLHIRGDQAGPLFCHIHKHGKVYLTNVPIRSQSMDYILQKRIAQSKIKPLVWHDFRRSLIGTLLSSGVDIVTIGKMVSHSSPAQTARYDRRDESKKIAAMQYLHVPYSAKF